MISILFSQEGSFDHQHWEEDMDLSDFIKQCYRQYISGNLNNASFEVYDSNERRRKQYIVVDSKSDWKQIKKMLSLFNS
jgi:hypothetical protein